ncbi:MAG: non-ribosomal peptide synthetase, partial [bacterium]|nr:non-ribosomal peptide synthetase [bacterium]
IPLTPNGKVDRERLPLPEAKTGDGYPAPANQKERALAKIWSEVLDLEEEKIAVNVNFFEIGGHSLNAMSLVSKIHKEFNSKINLKEIFGNPTIETQAKIIGNALKDKFIAVETVEKKEYYQLSPAQKRLYVLHCIAPESLSYNMPQAVFIEGKLSREQFEEIFKRMIGRHESFRTSLCLVNRKPVQKINKDVEFKLDYDALEEADGDRDIPVDMLIKDFVRVFDLAQAPLIRVKLIKTGEKKHLLLVDIHHIISDARSGNILLQEFVEMLLGKVLPVPRVQYKDFARWQNRRLEGKEGNIKEQEEYWLELFKGNIPVLEIPTDYPRPEIQQFEGDNVCFTIENNLYNRLNQRINESGTTLYIFLSTILFLLLYKYTGQEDIVIGTPVSGRQHIDLERIIGMFVGQ